jgi:hypothetical protein
MDRRTDMVKPGYPPDKVCQWLATGTSISSTNKTESHDIAEILEKVALKHPNPNQRCSRIMDLDLVFESDIKEPFLYPPQQSCRGVSWFHHVRPSVHPSVRPSVCRQILCRTNTRSRSIILEQLWLGLGCFNATFSNISAISWLSVLLVEEIEVPVASHWQTLSYNVVLSTPCHERCSNLTTLVMIDTDCIGS